MWEKLTKDQEEVIGKGNCPDCSGRLFEGPWGGFAVNMICRDCEATFWVSWPFSPKRVANPQVKNETF